MQSAGGDQNIRRENKLYSYADQMAELELRKVFTLDTTIHTDLFISFFRQFMKCVP